jgi:hypothetical protein
MKNTLKQTVLYYEDLLQQKEFSLEDWRKAKRKRSVRFFINSTKFAIKTFIEEKFWQTKRFLSCLCNK